MKKTVKTMLLAFVASSLMFATSCSKDDDVKNYNISVVSSNTTMGSVSITPNGTVFNEGTTVTIQATPNEGYRFVSWTGGSAGTTNPYSFAVNSHMTYVAIFEAIPSSPADDFVGNYSLSGTLTLNLPETFGGTRSIPVTNRSVTIESSGNSGDVVIILDGNSYDGYVNNSGLHVDPIVVNYNLGLTTLALTVTIPTISRPVNGTTSCQASITTSFSGYTITGMADVVATKVN